jgi:hypothetical protein
MATRRFPLCPHAITYYPSDGTARTIKAEVFGDTIEVHPDDDHLGDAMVAAIHALGHNVDTALQERGRVADIDDWSLAIRVYARVKAWPVVPGVTIENPMPKDAS